MERKLLIVPVFSVLLLLSSTLAAAQPISGYWKGKIKGTNIELKLIRKGDSLVGSSYYYQSPESYRRYSIRGYFDGQSNDVVWWDEELLAEKTNRAGTAMMAVADFNCPDPNAQTEMRLEGEAGSRDNAKSPRVPLKLQKTGSTLFPDEWDYVLENYNMLMAEPEIIDSIAALASGSPKIPPGYEAVPVPVQAMPVEPAGAREEKLAPEAKPLQVKTAPESNEEKFNTRAKQLQTIIPLKGDSLELRFYDNAEIDGDSIAIFLNGRMLEEHVLLSDQPHIIRLPVALLANDNELVMVAENLGSIPPNTSLMVALVGGNRYEARLQSTEGSSALVRLVRDYTAPPLSH